MVAEMSDDSDATVCGEVDESSSPNLLNKGCIGYKTRERSESTGGECAGVKEDIAGIKQQLDLLKQKLVCYTTQLEKTRPHQNEISKLTQELKGIGSELKGAQASVKKVALQLTHCSRKDLTVSLKETALKLSLCMKNFTQLTTLVREAVSLQPVDRGAPPLQPVDRGAPPLQPVDRGAPPLQPPHHNIKRLSTLNTTNNVTSSQTCPQATSLVISAIPIASSTQTQQETPVSMATQSSLYLPNQQPVVQQGSSRGNLVVTPADLPQNSQLTSSDFSQIVPLEDLIKEKFLKPEYGCLSVVLMGVKFVSSLKHDGSIETAAGVVYRYPNQWINGCWEKIGHKGKKMRLAAAYKIVLYKNQPLLNICQIYNQNKVQNYLKESNVASISAKKKVTSTSNQEHMSNVTTAHRRDLGMILAGCKILMIRDEELGPPPPGLWDSEEVILTEELQKDLEWHDL